MDELIPAIEAEGLRFRYPSGDRDVVGPVDLRVEPGEFVLLTGPTGCGKSTLLRLLAGLPQRHGSGRWTGTLSILGHDPASLPPRRRVEILGLVAQEPGDQLVTSSVREELAFALRARGRNEGEVEVAVADWLHRLGLAALADRGPARLSGGQQQRTCIAAALSAGAALVLLDEPLAQLDPEGAREVLEALSQLSRSGVTVVIVEHRIEISLGVVSRVLLMDEGRIVSDRPAGEPDLPSMRRLGLSVPPLLELASHLGIAAESLSWAPVPAVEALPDRAVGGCSGLHAGYGGDGPPVLKGIDLEVRAGERLAILGANGSGKSTLLRLLAGEQGPLAPKRRAGSCWLGGVAVSVPQDPDLALWSRTVRDELAYGPRERRLDSDAVTQRVAQVGDALGLSRWMDRAPQALSRGQRLRTAVAAALTCQPAILLLDEPTAGQDGAHVDALFRSLDALDPEIALVFATHDLDLVLRRATRVLVLIDGRLACDGAPAEVLHPPPPGSALVLSAYAAFCLDRGLPLLDPSALLALQWPGGAP